MPRKKAAPKAKAAPKKRAAKPKPKTLEELYVELNALLGEDEALNTSLELRGKERAKKQADLNVAIAAVRGEIRLREREG